MSNNKYLMAFGYIYTLVDKTLRARNRYRIIKNY